jgi:hypothetical protein
VTGSGKTFTMANVIAQLGRPTLVISHNKTLAAQLYSELKEFFPRNAVEYFVSYYDYYQPEAYIPQTDTYIEKDASINEEIERLRLAATDALINREDVVIVASVSCIYGLGSPEDYRGMLVTLRAGEEWARDEVMRGWWTCSTRATTWRPAGDVPRARRHAGHLSVLQQGRGAGRVLRRHHREPAADRSADGQDPADVRPHDDFAGQAFRDARREDPAGHRAHPGRDGGAGGRTGGAGQAAGSPAPAHAHHVRHGDAARGGLLQRHRELFRAALGPPGGFAARTR